MKDVKLTNIPTMNIGRIVDDLTNVYSTVIKQKLPVKTVPSVMLWGAPGVGKSQAIRQLAKGIEENTGKKVVVTDVRLLLFNPSRSFIGARECMNINSCSFNVSVP